MSALDNSIREVSALGKASRVVGLPGRGAPVNAAPGATPMSPGACVLDLVTGEIGVIQSVAVQSVTIPNT